MLEAQAVSSGDNPEPLAARGHEAVPARVLADIAKHSGTIIVDFDETLYLRNSTEDFLNALWPGLLGLLLLRAVDIVKPWRFAGGLRTRDAWRVRLATLLFPWLWSVWRRRADALVDEYTNVPLREAIAGRSDVVIATIGFEPIIRPMLERMGLGHLPLVSSRFASLEDRRVGKLALVRKALGEEALRHALVVTDSRDDEPLLDACGSPRLVVWPDARYRPALSHVYMPWEYMTKVKRPGQRELWRGILQEDYLLWVFASISLTAAPATHVVGLLLLLVSFWAIYERGYVDNDETGVRLEKDPQLSDAFHLRLVATPAVEPWIWAGIFGIAGVTVLAWPQAPNPLTVAAWGVVLVGTYACFKLYNRIDKATRVWFYPLLQLARTAAFAAVVSIDIVGAAALGAHVIARSFPYFAYRAARKNVWPYSPVYLKRLMFFLVLAGLMLASVGPGAFPWLTSGLITVWAVFRAWRELLKMLRQARLLAMESSDARGNSLRRDNNS